MAVDRGHFSNPKEIDLTFSIDEFLEKSLFSLSEWRRRRVENPKKWRTQTAVSDTPREIKNGRLRRADRAWRIEGTTVRIIQNSISDGMDSWDVRGKHGRTKWRVTWKIVNRGRIGKSYRRIERSGENMSVSKILKVGYRGEEKEKSAP